ncbi:MAG TPA: alpha/beta hydrolase [Vicinamibacterales bacterium]
MQRQRAQLLSDIAIKPTFRTIDGVSVRFVESEPGDADALLLSPWPESVFAYEPIWSRLAGAAHLVAIDLPGFGRSDRSDALMSPSAMGDFILRVTDAFGLERPHIVGPDVGTSAALFAAAAQPERFLSLVVGTGATAVPIQLGDPLREWVFAPDLKPYRRLGRTPDRRARDPNAREVRAQQSRSRRLPRVVRGPSIRRLDSLRTVVPDRA